MLDKTALQNYFAGDATMLRRFIRAFVQQTPELVNRMDEAIAAGDWQTVSTDAHTLRGQLKYFGFPEETGQLENLERMAESRSGLNRLPQLWADFSPRLGAVYEQLALLE